MVWNADGLVRRQLETEEVLEGAGQALAPPAAARVHENAIARPSDTALEDVADSKVLPDIADVDALALARVVAALEAR